MTKEKIRIIEIKKSSGRILQVLRKQSGLSQFDLALELGFTNHYLISKIETGKETIPPKHIKAIARILSTPEQVFIDPLIEIKRLQIESEIGHDG